MSIRPLNGYFPPRFGVHTTPRPAPVRKYFWFIPTQRKTLININMSAAGATFGQRVWAKMPSVHIVAPICKWMLVIAGLKDTQRPVEKLSGTQQIALMATGVIWTRWAGFVIKPRNPLLASVNFFLGAVAGYQVSRIAKWRLEEGDSAGQIAYYIFEGKPAEGCKPVVEPSAALESTI